ncbi:MAG: ABC transporter ATP-binding protein [Planctomycetaceae bacterium]|nr:ABC transporter ATP-binding protein [Planctomycetaceae bacterium]
MLEVENLSFQFGKEPVFSDISFEIPAGTIAAVLGPNGAGKTTLLRCINSILKPKSGKVRLNGASTVHLSPAETARRISYMPQRCGMTGMTVFDSVLLGRKPYFTAIVSAEDLRIVEEMLDQLSLRDKALRRLDCLSGGELQKVSLARILVQSSQLLLLDEPASSLDLKNKLEIFSLLKDFVHQRQLSVLMSIHDLNDALRFCDRLLFLKNKKLAANKTPETLTADVVETVYGIPVELHNTEKYRFIVPM